MEAEDTRKKAKKCSDTCTKKMIDKEGAKHPPSKCNVGEKVFVDQKRAQNLCWTHP